MEEKWQKDMVSVIIPVYKVEKYLEQCLDSILNQTYSRMEILLVDDGSPDRCGEICDDYAGRDARVRVIHKTNGGLSDARNAGIEVASGSWLVFVDSDDYIHPQMIELLYRTAQREQAEIVWCGIAEVDEEGVCADQAVQPGSLYEILKVETVLYNRQEAERQFYTVKNMQPCMVTWNKIYAADLFRGRLGEIRFPKGKIYEDGYTTYRLIYAAERIATIPCRLYYYRQRSGSIMNVNSHRTYEAALESGLERMAFYREHEEEELYRLELNLTIYSVIRFYQNNEAKADKICLKEWYRKIYYGYFVKENWPLAKKIRMRSFLLGDPCYRFISGFESLYNHLRKD